MHFHIFGGLRASLVVASWPNIDCVVPGSSRVITAMRTPLMDLEVRKENFVILYIKYAVYIVKTLQDGVVTSPGATKIVGIMQL